MKRKTQQLLNKAREAVEAAEILLEAGKNDFAAGRAYYAMFYVAEALLFEKGLEFRKHGVFTQRLVSISSRRESWTPSSIAISLRHLRPGWKPTMGWTSF